jgi:hypothetical protein
VGKVKGDRDGGRWKTEIKQKKVRGMKREEKRKESE